MKNLVSFGIGLLFVGLMGCSHYSKSNSASCQSCGEKAHQCDMKGSCATCKEKGCTDCANCQCGDACGCNKK